MEWKQPKESIQKLFEQRITEGPQHLQDHKGWGVSQLLETWLQEQQNYNSIPSLNSMPLHDLPSGSLVKYRCLVQDMFDPEYYLGIYDTVNQSNGQRTLATGLFAETHDIPEGFVADHNSDRCRMWQRLPLYCVPVPGETPWAEEMSHQRPQPPAQAQPSGLRPGKRGQGWDQEVAMTGELGEGSADGMECEGGEAASGADVKKPHTAQPPSPQPTAETAAAVPLQAKPAGMECIVKLYDEDGAPKINDAIEVVGVLCVDPVLAEWDQQESDFAEERSAHHPPTSRVPRLHCIALRPLGGATSYAPQWTPMDKGAALQQLQPQMPVLRAELVRLLSSALGGDGLAAEYCLLNLISTIHTRMGDVCLGRMGLSLSAPNSSPATATAVAESLSAVIRELLPRAFYLPLSLQSLNQQQLYPYKDHTSNRLMSGVLQIADGTSLVVDETKMTEGNLQEKGVKNMGALQSVLQNSKLPADFQFHQMDFPIDTPTIVVSNGKSLLHSDLPCTLHITQAPSAVAVDPTILNSLRLYLSLVRDMEYQLPPEVAVVAEDHFVAARATSKDISQEDFHQWLTVSRLLSLSHGQPSLTEELWTQAQAMETSRVQRNAGGVLI